MSVGLQRLRDEPEVIRRGALDKGEDATLVDTALALDARRRALLGEARRLQGGAQHGVEADRRGDQAAARRPTVRRSRHSRHARSTAGERIAALDVEHRRAWRRSSRTLLLRIPNPADPDVPVGGRRRERHRPDLGRPAAARPARRR